MMEQFNIRYLERPVQHLPIEAGQEIYSPGPLPTSIKFRQSPSTCTGIKGSGDVRPKAEATMR